MFSIVITFHLKEALLRRQDLWSTFFTFLRKVEPFECHKRTPEQHEVSTQKYLATHEVPRVRLKTSPDTKNQQKNSEINNIKTWKRPSEVWTREICLFGRTNQFWARFISHTKRPHRKGVNWPELNHLNSLHSICEMWFIRRPVVWAWARALKVLLPISWKNKR